MSNKKNNKSKESVKNKNSKKIKINLKRCLFIILMIIILILILKYVIIRICFYNQYLNSNINVFGFIKTEGDETIVIEDSNYEEYIEFENLKIKNNFKEYVNIKENNSNSSKYYFKNEENIIEENYKSIEYTFVDSDKKENITLEIINETEIDIFKDTMKDDLKMTSLEVNNYLIENDIHDDLDFYKHISDEIFTFNYNKKIISTKEINKINVFTSYANKYKKEIIFIEGKYEGYISRLGNNYQIYIWNDNDRYMIKLNFSNDKYNKEYVVDLAKSIVIG